MLGGAQNPPRQVQAVLESPRDYLAIISPAMFAQDGWNAIPLNTARVMVVRVALGEGKTRILGKGLCDLAKHNGQLS